VSFTFTGDSLGNRATTVTNTTPVLKGSPTIVVTQTPATAVVGQEIAIGASINGFALGSEPEYVTLKFIDGLTGQVRHTISDIAMTKSTANTAAVEVIYTYVQAHTNLILEFSFVGNANYNGTSGRTTTIVSPAPTI